MFVRSVLSAVKTVLTAVVDARPSHRITAHVNPTTLNTEGRICSSWSRTISCPSGQQNRRHASSSARCRRVQSQRIAGEKVA
jgi:hypothetical protein